MKKGLISKLYQKILRTEKTTKPSKHGYIVIEQSRLTKFFYRIFFCECTRYL